MSQVNFLPESYREQRRLRRQRVADVFLAIVMVAALGGWWTLLHADHSSDRAEVEQLEQELDDRLSRSAGNQWEVMNLQQQRDVLAQRVSVTKELSDRVMYYQVLSALSQLFPGDATVTSLRFQTDRQTKANKPKAGARRTRGGKKEAEKAPAPDKIQIDVEGIAADDATVSKALTDLQRSPMFENVKLHFSRDDERTGMLVRSFSLSAEVRLRTRIESPSIGKEHADAS